MLKKSLLSALVLGAFASSAFALDCPTVGAIQAEQLDTAVASAECKHKFTVSKVSHFGTDVEWTFTIDRIRGKDEASALKHANKSLARLKGGDQPPVLDDTNNTNVCTYQLGHHHVVTAKSAVVANPTR